MLYYNEDDSNKLSYDSYPETIPSSSYKVIIDSVFDDVDEEDGSYKVIFFDLHDPHFDEGTHVLADDVSNCTVSVWFPKDNIIVK